MSEQAPDQPTREIGELLPLAYDELRAIAAAYLRRERPDHTLQATALVHEAYLKLQRAGSVPGDRVQFMARAAGAMRQILVDHARARAAKKRGGGWRRVTVESDIAFAKDGIDDVLAVDEALSRLARLDPRAAQIVELRFFSGLTEVEVAGQMGASERWVREQWAHARAWLGRELEAGGAGS
jgi:RNA polymerase sigma factor (TIGR02999 family)